jgi:hypothetical protein
MVSNAPKKGDHAATKICCFGAGAEKSLGASVWQNPRPFSTAAYSKKRHRQAISSIDRMPNIGGDPFSGRSCCASGRGAAHVGG